MKRSIYGICTAALLALGACTTDELPAPDKTQPDGTEQTKPVSGEVLVKFKSYVSDILDQTAARTRSGGPATRSGILSVDEVLDLVGGYEIERVFPVDPRTEARTREAGLNLWYVVRFDKEYTVEEVVERLSQLGEVQYANPNRTIKRAYNPQTHVACVGGTSFGAPECIRMSYATSDENIVEAIRRIKEALAKLK